MECRISTASRMQSGNFNMICKKLMSAKRCEIDGYIPSKILQAALQKIFIDWPYWRKCWNCHQLPDRSFFLANRQFQICARCTGIVIGVFLLPFLLLVYKLPTAISISLIFLATADGFTQLLRLRKSTNQMRLFTGLTFPWAVASIVLILI